jgi:hypothetical protein
MAKRNKAVSTLTNAHFLGIRMKQWMCQSFGESTIERGDQEQYPMRPGASSEVAPSLFSRSREKRTGLRHRTAYANSNVSFADGPQAIGSLGAPPY